MLGSNHRINQKISSIPAAVRDTIRTTEQYGTAEDRLAAIRTYRATLDSLEKDAAQDSKLEQIINANPYVNKYTYGHFLAVLQARYMQCSSVADREMLRLKYYPIAFTDPGYTSTEWTSVIDELSLSLEVDSPWLYRMMKVLTLGFYRGLKGISPVAPNVTVIENKQQSVAIDAIP